MKSITTKHNFQKRMQKKKKKNCGTISSQNQKKILISVCKNSFPWSVIVIDMTGMERRE